MKPQLTDIAQQLEAALARHPEVRKQDVRVEAADKFERAHAVFSDFPAKSPRLERLAPLLVRVHVVFGDQYSNFIGHKVPTKKLP